LIAPGDLKHPNLDSPLVFTLDTFILVRWPSSIYR
jgi:hypothetical protein